MTQSTDLPEPKRREFSQEEKLQRQWSLLATFLIFVAGYATLHKLFIPFVLSFTRLVGTPYALIDWWFVHPVILAILIQRGGRNTPRISFLAGVAIVYGAYEVYEAAQGRYLGWLMFSRLLSAVPVAVGCGYLMSRKKFGGSMRAAWFGAVTLLLLITLRESPWTPPQGAVPKTAVDQVHRNMPDGEFASCGAQSLTIKPDVHWISASEIEIADCGFSPSVLFIENGQLEISNSTSQAVNMRFFISEGGKPHSKWNILIPAHSKAVHELVISDGASGLLISDSAPSLGLVAVLPRNRMETWAFSRKPISIESVP